MRPPAGPVPRNCEGPKVGKAILLAAATPAAESAKTSGFAAPGTPSVVRGPAEDEEDPAGGLRLATAGSWRQAFGQAFAPCPASPHLVHACRNEQREPRWHLPRWNWKHGLSAVSVLAAI